MTHAHPTDRASAPAFDPSRRAQLVVAPASLLALHAALAAALGPAAAATLQAAGYATGQEHASALHDWLAERGDGALESLALPAFGERLRSFFRELGWGELALHTNGPVSEVEVRRWAEWQARGEGEAPACHFTTGMLAGFFGALAEHPLAVLEVEPGEATEGAARFVVGNEQLLNDLFDRLQQGDDADSAIAAVAAAAG